MFQGTLNAATVFPQEIVRRALQLNAAAMVAVHNHPSGNPAPSADDHQVTRELQRACRLMDISLLDHIVSHKREKRIFREEIMLIVPCFCSCVVTCSTINNCPSSES